jgi:hypothetical protein
MMEWNTHGIGGEFFSGYAQWLCFTLQSLLFGTALTDASISANTLI